MPSFVLTDVAHDLWLESFRLTPEMLGLGSDPAWSVTKRTLRGGRRDGVDVVEVDSGALSLSVLPTRGMNLWRGRYHADRLGWDSPVRDGPVHPAHVNLMSWGGLGWIDGFDELLARCGLEHNGAPYSVKAVQADGSERHTLFPLHGRISNIPAHRVEVRVAEEPPYALTIEGQVDESRLFGPQVRLTASLTCVPGSNRAVLRDEFRNLGDTPTDLQILYHWNLGPPHMDEGSRFVAPARAVVPRDPRAVEGLDRYDLYPAPEPGSTEQVYFFELEGAGTDGRTAVLLRNAAGDRGVALRFATRSLPCFTLWKNTAGRCDGYVTGLEPATNYPNPKPFEQENGRVIRLAPGAMHVAETVLEVVDSAAGVASLEDEIRSLQGRTKPDVSPGPRLPFASGG